MKTKFSLAAAAFLAAVFLSGCGSQANCPVCGTTKNGTEAIVDIIPVPEHNPTGEPGGPFNSFDDSVVDPVHHLFYVSDRIGLDVDVVDTNALVPVNTIGGVNAVAQAGNNASPCVPTIPPLISALGNFTRYGCRTGAFSLPGAGANGLFGGFPGAQCCASRGNGINPLSGPDGEVITADGNTLFSGNGSSTVVVFDLTTNPPTVIASIPTGQAPDFDGPNGVSPCIASASGRGFDDPTCGDLRADEMSYDEQDKILLVTNGDPALPFATLIDMSAVVNRTGNCLPVNPAQPYGPTISPVASWGRSTMTAQVSIKAESLWMLNPAFPVRMRRHQRLQAYQEPGPARGRQYTLSSWADPDHGRGLLQPDQPRRHLRRRDLSRRPGRLGLQSQYRTFPGPELQCNARPDSWNRG